MATRKDMSFKRAKEKLKGFEKIPFMAPELLMKTIQEVERLPPPPPPAL